MIVTLAAAMLTAGPYAILNAIIFHFFRPKKRVKSMIIVFIFCLPVAAYLCVSLQQFSVLARIPMAIQCTVVITALFAFAFYVYLQAYFAITSSITLEYLYQMKWQGNGVADLKDLERVFSIRRVLHDRLGAMVEKKLVIVRTGDSEDIYVPRIKCLAYGAVFSSIKNFLHWGAGG